MASWKPIPGFEGKYEVGDNGEVRYIRAKHQRKLKQKLNRHTGYLSVCLINGGGKKPTYKAVHRLVAEAFIPNPDGLAYVNHMDEDKTNNVVGNLEWCTPEYNTNYSKAKRYRRVFAYSPDGEKVATFESETFAASVLGVGKPAVSAAIKHGRCCQGLMLSLEDA